MQWKRTAGGDSPVLTCRSISPQGWARARELLVFYFSRRHQYANADDLAQDTILALLGRDDFEFEREEDFLRVCYGFARHVTQTACRQQARSRSEIPCDDSMPSSNRSAFRLTPTEMNVFLGEVLAAGPSALTSGDWQMLHEIAVGGSLPLQDHAEANRLRVRLHRARKRLAQFTGWTK